MKLETQLSKCANACQLLILCLCALVGVWSIEFGGVLPATAQSVSSFTGAARNFTMSEYHNPPHETQMKSLVTGVETQPLSGGRHLIKGLRLEMFDENGGRQMIIESPECIYDSVKRLAHSAGRIQARTGNGQFYIEGEGFLWRQDASTITISNRVHTIISQVAQTEGQQ